MDMIQRDTYPEDVPCCHGLSLDTIDIVHFLQGRHWLLLRLCQLVQRLLVAGLVVEIELEAFLTDRR